MAQPMTAARMPEFDSLSSALMTTLTVARNRNGRPGIIFAEGGYPLISLVAGVEVLASAIFCGIAIPLYPVCPAPLKFFAKELKSSAFCIPWAVADTFANPFLHPLIADEKSVRQMALNCDFVRVPHGSLY